MTEIRYWAGALGWSLFWITVCAGAAGCLFEWDHFYRFIITGG